MKIAIIGTAGRDKTIPMTRALWDWMLDDAKNRLKFKHHLVSGGAAWADHLACEELGLLVGTQGRSSLGSQAT